MTAQPGSAFAQPGPKPLTTGTQSKFILVMLAAFVTLPFVGLVLAVSTGIGGLTWPIAVVALITLCATDFGAGNGLHRYFTHGAFKAKRWLHITLGILGLSAVEGSITQWVADHRRHHQYTDIEGDPHSPWRFGTGWWGLTKGLFFAHMGWLFKRDLTNQERFAPDLLEDKDVQRLDRNARLIVTMSALVAPALLGGLLTWSWSGMVSGVVWIGLIRIATLHHITWSVNSICHVFGEQEFEAREGDKATNFWPLAIPSFGDSWHNTHHANPTWARHGVYRRQLDINARLNEWMERLGWIYEVRWPALKGLDRSRLTARQARKYKAQAERTRRARERRRNTAVA